MEGHRGCLGDPERSPVVPIDEPFGTPAKETLCDEVPLVVAQQMTKLCMGQRKKRRMLTSEISSCSWDLDPLTVREWSADVGKRAITHRLAVLTMFQGVVILILIAGVLGGSGLPSFLNEDPTAKSPHQGDRNAYYHVLVSIMCLTSIIQIVHVHKYYKLELETLPVTNPLWESATLLRSPVGLSYLAEMVAFSLHEPPGLALVWKHSYKLSLLAIFRSYIFWRLMRDRSFTQQQGGKLISAIARVKVTWLFQLKAVAYNSPWRFQVGISLAALVVLSAANLIATDQVDSMDTSDAVWLTFATMTSGEPRAANPTNHLARMVGAVGTMTGLVLVSLLISLVSRSMELSPKQKRMLLFMSQAERHLKIEGLAAAILCEGLRMMVSRRKGNDVRVHQTRIAQLCEEFRQVRRGFNSAISEFHALWPENMPMANKVRDLDIMVGALFDDRFPGCRKYVREAGVLRGEEVDNSPFQEKRETARFVRRGKNGGGAGVGQNPLLPTQSSRALLGGERTMARVLANKSMGAIPVHGSTPLADAHLVDSSHKESSLRDTAPRLSSGSEGTNEMLLEILNGQKALQEENRRLAVAVADLQRTVAQLAVSQ